MFSSCGMFGRNLYALNRRTGLRYGRRVLEKDVSEMAVNKIYDLAEGNIIADSREKNSEVSGSYWVFRIAAYSFLAIISLITILNIMNSVSMGVSARIKQYGVMRAVGMGSRQVTKMISC